MDRHDIGVKLKKVRESLSLTQEEVSFKLEVSTKEYRSYERGERYPSDETLKLLLEVFGYTQDEFDSLVLINHDKRKRILQYTQITIVSMMLLGYFLPFTQYQLAPAFTKSGFDIMFEKGLFGTFFVGAVFLAICIQLIIMVLSRIFDWSSVFNLICVFLSFVSIVVLWIGFRESHYMDFEFLNDTYIIFAFLFISYIAIALFHLVKYPMEHDFLGDIKKVRQLFLLIVNVIYFGFFLYVYTMTFMDPNYNFVTEELILYSIWGVYHIMYVILLIFKKPMFDTRKWSSIFLGLPAVIFYLFFLIYYFIEGELENMTGEFTFIPLFMLTPVLMVNLDYIIDILKGLFKYQE